MKIAVVGAAGMVGSRVVTEALQRGHDVTAVFRSRIPSVQKGCARFAVTRPTTSC